MRRFLLSVCWECKELIFLVSESLYDFVLRHCIYFRFPILVIKH